MSRSRFLYNASIAVALLLFIAWSLFPIYWMLSRSLLEGSRIQSIPPDWIFWPTMENYQTLLQATDFVPYFKNTFIVSSLTTVLALIFGVAAAYSLTRFRFPGSDLIPTAFLVLRMVPRVAVIIPYYVLMRAMGLIDTYLALTLSYSTFALPFVVWMMIGFFKEIPIELEEAAQVDGCSRLRAVIKVVLPVCAPGIAATGIFAFLLGWNEFLFSAILSGRETRTLPVLIASFVTDREVRWGVMSAGGSLIILPIVALSIVIQKYIVRGLSMGSVKG